MKDGYIVGLGDYKGRQEFDLDGTFVIPGLIDAHVHIESSLLTPIEYARLVLARGTTTVVADPHEVANVCGMAGIDYVLAESRRTPLDILVMLPSCVPATPLDSGGAVLSAADLAQFLGQEGVLGLAEVMNVPGVLDGDPDLVEKMRLFDVVDGHAPLLSGADLNAYIYAGIQSDHESTTYAEAREKLFRGMYVMIREGSTERNLRDLIGIVNACTAARCCFATDDRHADMLVREGHIDDCIRKAVACGLEVEQAIRMATLSAAERFGLRDRGAISPGRLADFCIIDDLDEFHVLRTFKRGTEVADPGYIPPIPLKTPFRVRVPSQESIRINGRGEARIIGIAPGQIITLDLRCIVDGSTLPDTDRDILKVVVTDRYRDGGSGVGLVQGLGLQEGAIAGSVSHDSHNIVAIGADDAEIIRAIEEVKRLSGGLVVTSGEEVTALPLESAGLMSTLPHEEVVERLAALSGHARRLGAIEDPFMYLSFLALTVIPELRVTERGIFDVQTFADVPLFCR